MPVTQLTDEGEIVLPGGRVKLDLVSSFDAELLLTRLDDGSVVQPFARISGASMVLDMTALPADALVAGLGLVARPRGGRALVDGDTADLTIRAVASTDDALRRQARAFAAQQTIMLAVIAQDDTRVVLRGGSGAQRRADPMEARGWHDAGRRAFYGVIQPGAVTPFRWSMVIDGSASMLTSRRSSVRPLLETLVALFAAGSGGRPERILVTGASTRDVWPFLDQDDVSWDEVLGDVPAPWARLSDAVGAVSQDLTPADRVLLVCDGVPADALDLVSWSATAEVPQLNVVALGRSHHEIDDTARPTSWWDEELAALEPIGSSPLHRLVSVADPAAIDTSGTRLAASLFAARVAV
ncbi:hypothetical protein [Rudaeicoccus suwonensis]|uniref:Uncharacterized protein n=1 Tax=Rudaeicoccus suwonensis TaxID=657409 RepID=A0A561E0X1_9MICO|nr:hypothetical protein [Rudaeicoccus suwonensis]TWE09230.1 hypothetical protein BKA23_2930 [Rudaeicoccus suwonensis]